MRKSVVSALTISVLILSGAVARSGFAQTATPAPGAARENGAIEESASDAVGVAVRSLNDTPATAAAGRSGKNRILSQNELYNLGRASEGRVSLRVGSDMSYRVEKRAGTP